MNNFDSKLESNDVLFVIADDDDDNNDKKEAAPIVADGTTDPTAARVSNASGSGNPVPIIQTPKCFCTHDESDDGTADFANAWQNIRGLSQTQAPKCADIFMGNVDCSMNVPCCCGLRPKMSQRKAPSSKGINSKKKVPKVARNTQQPSTSNGCQSCAQSRKYLDYLSKTLTTLRQMSASITSSCPEEGRKRPPQKRRKTRTRKASMPPLPRCSCPAPCGTLGVHTKCVDDIDIVPKDMGWNWKLNSNQRKGWRPGAIPRSVRELMCHFLKPCPCDTLPVGALTGGESAAPPCIDHSAQAAQIPQRPMIKVQRKNDEYVITMNPLKSARELKTEPDPYMNCDPIHVRITANREDERMAQIKQIIRDSGFRRCKCGRAVAQCTCRDNRELEALRTCVENCGTKYGIADLGEKLSLNRLKDLELEFTPPAAVVKTCLQPVPESALQETQYNENDLKQRGAAGSGSNGKGGKGGKGGKVGKDGGKGDGKDGGKRGADKKGDKKGGGSTNSSQTSLTSSDKQRDPSRRPGKGDRDGGGTGKSSKSKRGGSPSGSDLSQQGANKRGAKGKGGGGKGRGGRDGDRDGSVDRAKSKGKGDGKTRGGRDGKNRDGGGSDDSLTQKDKKGKGKGKDGRRPNQRGGDAGGSDSDVSIGGTRRSPRSKKPGDKRTTGHDGSADSQHGTKRSGKATGRHSFAGHGSSRNRRGSGGSSYSLIAEQRRKTGRKTSGQRTSEWLALFDKLKETMQPTRCCQPCPGRFDVSHPRLCCCCCCQNCRPKAKPACVNKCSPCSYLWPPWTPDQQSRTSWDAAKCSENRVRPGCW